MRVLIITSTPPIPSGGGSMLLYRHFCERNDFDISVVTDNPQICDYDLPYQFTLLKHSQVWNRLLKTRFSKPLHSLAHLWFGIKIPADVWQQAQSFAPDAVLTVAGSWSWTSRLAHRVAQRLDVPLVSSFMDWWYYNQIYSNWAAPKIESVYRKIYQQSELALCISEGMQEAMGKHPNSTVIYPIGSPRQTANKAQLAAKNNKFTLAFGGNLGDWYGQMLEPLILAAQSNEEIQFRLYGPRPSWSIGFDKQARSTGIYCGRVPLPELQAALKKVDALFLLMGFEDECAQVERTSFKSKFLEYLSFQKPIFVWGPEYCSAVYYGRKFDSAEVCTSSDPKDFLKTIMRVKNDPARQQQLVDNAQRMYSEQFNPERIHRQLVSKMKELVA